MSGWRVCRAIVVMALAFPAGVWAQPLEVDNVDTTRSAVERGVEQLLRETKDPDAAAVIREVARETIHDIEDNGRLDNREMSDHIERFREVREISEKVMRSEIETRINEMAHGNPEVAERMRSMYEAMQQGGSADVAGGTDTMRSSEGGGFGPQEVPPEMRARFEQEYQRVVSSGDHDQAEMMKAGFEAFERGEMSRPTPEMMERMRGEMEHYLQEHPDGVDYARAEMEHLMEVGGDHGAQNGASDSAEHAHEAFDRWASEPGRTPEEIAKAREMMDKGFETGFHDAEMGRGMEQGHEGMMDPRDAFREWANSPEGQNTDRETLEQYREMAERYQAGFEHNYDNQLEQRTENLAEAYVKTIDHFADHNGDGIPEHHPHEIFHHLDDPPDVCHDHATDQKGPC